MKLKAIDGIATISIKRMKRYNLPENHLFIQYIMLLLDKNWQIFAKQNILEIIAFRIFHYQNWSPILIFFKEKGIRKYFAAFQ